LRTDTTETELRRMLIEAHGVSEETAARDIAAFLNQLEQHGLLTRAPAPVID
jgi:DeoR/GlpR family transcriptional regulator of sugar metabolism